YFAVKGGGFVALTGGSSRVFGPENSMIEDNNALGLALVMLLPLLNYLRITSRRRYVRLALIAVIGLTFIAVVGTYSRGALLALLAAFVVIALRSRSGIAILLGGGIVVAGLTQFMPAQWVERKSTILSYDPAESFEGRTAAWKTSVNIATERAFGGGFSAVDLEWVAQEFHSPCSLTHGRAAHSIYFEVLGDHGFVGLALYGLVLIAAGMNTVMV